MSILNMIRFGGGSGQTPTAELPEVFPFPIDEASFVELDLRAVYTRILTDVLERTSGVPDDILPLLSDNCLGSEMQSGLVSMIAKAMVNRSDLFLVYKAGIVREATSEEKGKIKADYAAQGKSSEGVYLTFKDFYRSDLLKVYSAMDYHNIGSFFKTANLAKSLILKIKNLRSSVSSMDSKVAIDQAQAVANALKNGKAALLDGEDAVEIPTPDITAAKEGASFIDQKKSFYLGLPASWITGFSSKGGISDQGEGDQKAVERGLKSYYFAIIRPVIKALFNADTTFKTEDYTGLTTSLDALRTFEGTSDEFLSGDNKRKILNSMFGLGIDTQGDS